MKDNGTVGRNKAEEQRPLHIGVVGAGPVGLALADAASTRGYPVTLIEPDLTTLASDAALVCRPTHPAAAAFWTPFCSGVTPEMEAALSVKSLEFYHRILHEHKPPGLAIRRLQQHFVANTVVFPAWSRLPQLKFRKNSKKCPHVAHEVQDFPTILQRVGTEQVRTRLEFSYSAPVVQVDRFLAWYRDYILQRPGVQLATAPGGMVGPSNVAGGAQWRTFLANHRIDRLVLCTGVGTFFGGVVSQDGEYFSPRKGVVAHLPVRPQKDSPVLLYEGGFFDVDTLYMVPLEDRYLLGGTVHAVSIDANPNSWEVTEGEKTAVLERARCFLPQRYQSLVPDVHAPEIKWLAGVRPVLQNCGPLVGRSQILTQFLTSPAQELEVFLNCGHGGSGFTFFQDTAAEVMDQIEGLHPIRHVSA
jgi:glycine/D-amino acid oxidase-like deaminating enzyme